MITGDPGAVEDAALTTERAGRNLDDAADDVGHHRRAATADWSGEASDAANVSLEALTARIDVGGPNCRSLASVLFDYARELRAAQQEYVGQQALAGASLGGSPEPEDFGAPTRTPLNAPALATSARTAMSDAVDRARRADEEAARRVDALVDTLAGMGSVPAGPGVLGPPSNGRDGPPAGPPVPQPDPDTPPSSAGGWSLGDLGHVALDVGGFIPGAGAVFDGANAAWYAAEGNYVEAGFSAAAMVPGAGDAVAAARLGGKGLKAAESAIAAEKAAQAAEAARTAWTIAPTNVLPSTRKTWVGTGRDTMYDVPAGWTQRMADNNKGLVFQKPGSTGNADQVRIAEPNPYNPDGYVRVYNQHGHAVNPLGKSAANRDTHVSNLYSGPFPGWPTG